MAGAAGQTYRETLAGEERVEGSSIARAALHARLLGGERGGGARGGPPGLVETQVEAQEVPATRQWHIEAPWLANSGHGASINGDDGAGISGTECRRHDPTQQGTGDPRSIQSSSDRGNQAAAAEAVRKVGGAALLAHELPIDRAPLTRRRRRRRRSLAVPAGISRAVVVVVVVVSAGVRSPVATAEEVVQPKVAVDERAGGAGGKAEQRRIVTSQPVTQLGQLRLHRCQLGTKATAAAAANAAPPPQPREVRPER
jgi:hypothetical protein